MRERQQRRPGRAGAGGGSTAISSTTSDPVREAAFGALDDAPSERAQHDHSCGPPPRLSHERHEYVEPREEHELPRQVEKQSPRADSWRAFHRATVSPTVGSIILNESYPDRANSTRVRLAATAAAD
jgi:hypothetical protein